LEKLESGHKNLKAKIKAQKKRYRKKASAKRSPKKPKHRQDKEDMAEQDDGILYEPATAAQMTSFLSPKQLFSTSTAQYSYVGVAPELYYMPLCYLLVYQAQAACSW